MTQGIVQADATGNLDLDGPQGFGDIVRQTEKMAPNGISWEQWRRSTNIEDDRQAGPDPGFGVTPERTKEQIQKDIDDAYKESQSDGEPSSVVGAFVDMVRGRMKFVDGGRYLKPAEFADLLNGFDDYIKSGGPNRDIAEYRKSVEYKSEIGQLRTSLKKLFQETFPDTPPDKIEKYIDGKIKKIEKK